MKNKLTATGIAPDFHRTSLLIISITVYQASVLLLSTGCVAHFNSSNAIEQLK
jgi:hypothetical protein